MTEAGVIIGDTTVVAPPAVAPAPPAVGRSVPRLDALAKVRGEARYVDDLPAEGELVGRTVRSSVPHGVLRDIRLDPAFDWRGVTVVTAADIPGRNCIRLHADDQPALVAAGDRIRHAAEPVALVAAPTAAAAAAAAAHVLLDVDPLSAALTVEDAMRGEVVVADGGNVLHACDFDHGDVDAAFATAAVVVEGTYRTGPAEHVYLEPQGMVARWDAGRVEVTGSLQCPFFVHVALTTLLGLDDDSVDVRQATTGGGFGGKEEYPSMLAAHAALLARAAGRPVRMVYERDEDLAATTKRHPSVIRHRLAADADGRLLAADVDVVLDAGAYLTLSDVVLLRCVLHVVGPYRVPAVRVRGRAVATNQVPSGAFRGFGAPQALFAAERQMAKLAAAVGVDPLELRRRNALRPGDPTSTGGTLDDSADVPALLDALDARLAAPAPTGARRATGAVRRARGVALVFHGAGFTGDGEARMRSQATVGVTPEGGFVVRTSITDMGQGARTVLAQLAADGLGVGVELVDVPKPSTRVVPDTGPTVASRSTMVAGTVVHDAASRLRSELLGGDGDDADVVSAARARAAAGDLPAVTAEYRLPGTVAWDQATLTGDAYPTYGWSATAVDVAVDEDTSEVTVERCVQVVDPGRAVNPLAVVGQVHGGTLQALGWALWEHVDRTGGALPSPSLHTVVIPTAVEAPEIEAVLVEVPFPGSPTGAKGVGELPLDGPAAAVANAVEAALGLPVDELPLRPELLHRLRGGGR